MKKQIKSAMVSFLVVFALMCAGLATAMAQDANANPDQQQAQAQDQSQDQAQDQDQSSDQNVNPSQDPSNRVAELNYSNGSVSFQPGGEGDWVDAVQNRPLTAGDNLWADKDSRAELHVGSTAMRIDSETSLTFLTLNDQTTQLRLSTGALILRVRHLDDGDTFEVDTPNLAFNIQRTGEYRIDVTPDGNQTLVTVWQGRGEATGGGDSFDVVAGQQARFAGTDQLDHEISQLPSSDDFDNWAFQRDQNEDRDESANYISTETTGYQDLDEYGHWHYAAGYGPVWSPAGIDAGWAPYRNGHWVFIAPWGWTWVEAEPWGFAPFHYGRWAFVESSWCWVPGPVAVRPVYAPAFVAFVGGNGFSLAIGGGPGVAWFPLAPGEVYMPWYRTSRVYVNNINISNTRVNVTQVTNVYNVYNSHTTNVTRITYVNQHMNRGVTVVSRDTFVNARPVRTNIVRVDEKTIVQAPVAARINVQPGRPSVIGAGRPVAFHPPAQVINRPVVGTRVPVEPRRPSFEQQRQAPEVKVQNPQPAEHPGTPRAPNQPAQPGFQANQRSQSPQPPNQPAEHPGTPRAPNQPAQPNFRVNQNPQPLQNPPNNQTQQGERNVPRPGNPQNQQGQQGGFRPMNQTQAPNQPEQNQNQRLVRPAPPVQQQNQQQQQNEEQKFHNWQEQRAHTNSAPPSRTETPKSAPPRQESKAPRNDDKKSDKH